MDHYLNTQDYFLSQEEFELRLDSKYEMLVTQPQPSNLGKYYQSDAYLSHSDSSKGFFAKAYQWAKRYNQAYKLKLLKRYGSSTGQLLDVGAGTGDFLIAAKKAGWKVAGTEPNPKARDKAFAKGLVLEEEKSIFQDEVFDIVTLWHVLEHVTDPHEEFQQLFRLLKPNGILVLAVPNFKSYDAQFYGKFWAAYDVPRHLFHFSRKSIELLAHEHDFQLKATKPMWFDAFYVAVLSEGYMKGKGSVIRAFWIALLSNSRVLFTKECSSLIYILQKK